MDPNHNVLISRMAPIETTNSTLILFVLLHEALSLLTALRELCHYSWWPFKPRTVRS